MKFDILSSGKHPNWFATPTHKRSYFTRHGQNCSRLRTKTHPPRASEITMFRSVKPMFTLADICSVTESSLLLEPYIKLFIAHLVVLFASLEMPEPPICTYYSARQWSNIIIRSSSAHETPQPLSCLREVVIHNKCGHPPSASFFMYQVRAQSYVMRANSVVDRNGARDRSSESSSRDPHSRQRRR